MKSGIVLSLAMAAALPLVADTTTANVIGLIRVDSPEKETIVSIPFVATSASATDAAIPVTDIVKTSNLTNGDELRYYNSSTRKYQCWRLTDGNWEAASEVSSGGAVSTGSTLARGDAIILVRQNPTESVNEVPRAKSFYLQGQVAKSASVECTMAQGSATAPAYSLIAPPSDTNVALNGGTWTGVGAKDQVQINGKLYWFDASSGKWGTYATDPTTFEKTFTPTDVTIAVGTGAWFISAPGATEAAQVTWSNLPSVQ